MVIDFAQLHRSRLDNASLVYGDGLGGAGSDTETIKYGSDAQVSQEEIDDQPKERDRSLRQV